MDTESLSMKNVLCALLIMALLYPGFASISLAQDEFPADDAGQKEDIEQNVNNMLKLLEDMQNNQEMSKELLIPKDEIDIPEAPKPFERLVKPDKKIIPKPAPIEKKKAENRFETEDEVVEFGSDFPERRITPGDEFPAKDEGPKEDIEQNVNDMVKLLEELENNQAKKDELFLPKDEIDKKEKQDPLERFVKPEKKFLLPRTPVENKKAKSSIETTNEVVRFDTDDPDSHFQLGLEYWVAKNLDDAILQFLEVIRLEPENAHAYWNLGLLYDASNKGPEAIANITKAKELYAKYNYSAYVGEAKRRLKRFSEKYGNPPPGTSLPE